mgnify:CR=1 FL=1
MAEKHIMTGLSNVEQAFVSAITWDKSDNLKKMGGIVDTQNVSTLSAYLERNRAEHPVSQDVIDSKRNKRTYVVPIDVTRADGSSFKMNLIVDSTGRDLAVMALTIDGKEAPESFKLAEKLNNRLQNNKKALESAIDTRTLEKVLDIKSLDELAEKNANGEKIVADNPKEALEEVKRKDSSVLLDENSIDEKKDEKADKEKEKTEEEQVIPKEYKGKIEEACEKAGIEPYMLKNAVFVRNPRSLTEPLEGENLTVSGGEVIVLQLRDGIENNKNILVQGDRVDKTGRFDDELSRRLAPNSKFGATVENSEVNVHEELVVEYELEAGQVVRINLDQEPINSRLSDIDKLTVQEQVKAIRKAWQVNLDHANGPDEVRSAYENANTAMNLLEKQTGVTLDPIQAEIETKKDQVTEEMEEVSDGYDETIVHYGRNINEDR